MTLSPQEKALPAQQTRDRAESNRQGNATVSNGCLQAENPFNQSAAAAERRANLLLAVWCARGTAGCELDPDLFPTPRHRQMARIVSEAAAEGIRTWPDVLPRMLHDEQLRLSFLEAVSESNLPASAQGGRQLAEDLRQFHILKHGMELGQQITKRIESGEDWQDLRQQLEALDRLKTADSGIESTLDARAFDFGSHPEKPIPIFRLSGMPLCTPGNLTNIQAPPKAGKSAVVDAMLAAAMNANRQGADTLGFDADNAEGHALIHFDTEQSRYDADALIRRACRRANVERPPVWFHSYAVADLDIRERRQGLRHAMEKARRQHGGIFAVLIDGIGDLCADPNDSEESFQLVHELHTLAIRHDCTIATVLHENPGSGETAKTRGHLGSQLERKAETNLRLAKDKDGITTIWAERARHCYLPKDKGPCFAYSDQHRMHVSCGTAGELKQAANREKMESEAEQVFADGESAMPYTALVSAIMESLDVSERTAKARIKTWLAEGITRKDSTGNHRLTNP